MIFFEKFVTVLSFLTVLLVGACVGFFTVVPLKSGMPDEVIDSQISLNDWLGQKRSPGGRAAEQAPILVKQDTVMAQAPGPGGKASAGPPKAVTAKESAAQTKTASFDNYIETDGRAIPQNEAVPGIPWVRAQPGVRYYKPRTVPTILYEKVQHFQDAYDIARQGSGEFRETDFGAAYRVSSVAQDSHLSRVAGLKEGDQILSINGHKVGNSFTAARQLYDQLKNEKKFAVKILREGQPTVLTFSVN